MHIKKVQCVHYIDMYCSEHMKIFYDIGAFYLRIIQTLATGLKLVPNGCSDHILDEFSTH